MGQVYEKARTFIYRNARPLDLARWQYLFEDGSKEPVLTALGHYQNEDGGFGHALEADSWNPNSAPMQTWVATEVLREIECTDSAHPLIQGILEYLKSGQDFDGHRWKRSIKSNDEYPHAPWWQAGCDDTGIDSYNPTACLAGFLIRFSEKGSQGYKLGSRLAGEAYAVFMAEERLESMHTLHCFIRLMEYLKEAGATDLIDLVALEERLLYQVRQCITKDTSEWGVSYVCKPSQFMETRHSLFYPDNKEIAEFEREFIEKTQQEDGSWNITWGWSDYPEEWAISKNWWKSDRIILNSKYLRGFM